MTKRYYANDELLGLQRNRKLYHALHDPIDTSMPLADIGCNYVGRILYDGFGGVLSSPLPFPPTSETGGTPDGASPIPYAAAKAGIQLMTQDLAVQVGSYNIRVNCIAPESILTERNQQRIPDELKPELAAQHPIERLGTPADVAHAALFLASDHRRPGSPGSS